MSCFSQMTKFSNLSQISHASQIDFQRAKISRNTQKETKSLVKKKNKKKKKNGKMEEENLIIEEIKSKSFRVSSIKSEGDEGSVDSEDGESVFKIGSEDKAGFDEKKGGGMSIFERIRLRRRGGRKRG